MGSPAPKSEVFPMRSFGTRALVAVGFSFLFALTAACGGAAPEAKAPSVDATDILRVGSGAPDLTSDTANAGTTPEAPKPAAVSSADNGSDIIPPFSAGKDPATKKASSADKAAPSGKPSKKTAGKKPKKKAAGA
jgi:hypothetical protein